jgi:hypothetical protein
MAGKIVTFCSDRSISNTHSKSTIPPERQLAHRFLDTVLDAKIFLREDCGSTDGDFNSVLHNHYNYVMHEKLQKNRRLSQHIHDRDYDGPRSTIRVIQPERYNREMPGFILRADDLISFDAHRFLSSSPRGHSPNAVAYKVTRIQKGIAALTMYFGYAEEKHQDDPVWCRQIVEFDQSAKRFHCPLCMCPVSELFLSAYPTDSQEHFGCVPCTAVLDLNHCASYEAALRLEAGGAE